jgi:hypothetical protein
MYLFFVRAFNDIDHITPVVWKMSRDNYPVAVYCINPEYDIQSDYRLRFLKELGVEVDFIYNDFDQKLGRIHRGTRFLMLASFAARRRLESTYRAKPSILSRIPQYLAQIAGILTYELTRRKFYNINWARSVLEKTGAKVVCFDWIRPHKHVVDVLLRAAKEMSISALALPHGVFLYTNERIKNSSLEEKVYYKYDRYDNIVVQNRLFKEVMSKSGVDKKKIFVLGSARYCKDWMAQNNEILPRRIESKAENAGKLRVIFMTTRPYYRINVEKMLKTFGILSNLEGIEVMVKPHTRTGKEADMYKNLPLSNVTDISSVELCEWADVVLVIASSIIIEALIKRKPVLYLKYLHGNSVEYEKFGACWTIHDENELKDALLSLKNRKRNVPYVKENVNRWLSEIIYGGRGEMDVLGEYERFIVNCANW